MYVQVTIKTKKKNLVKARELSAAKFGCSGRVSTLCLATYSCEIKIENEEDKITGKQKKCIDESTFCYIIR